MNVKTWSGYKEYVKSLNDDNRQLMEEIESLSAIISTIIAERKERDRRIIEIPIAERKSRGLSQRALAAMCDMPQSSVARIESMQTVPKLDTLLNIMRNLGLGIIVVKTAY